MIGMAFGVGIAYVAGGFLLAMLRFVSFGIALHFKLLWSSDQGKWLIM